MELNQQQHNSHTPSLICALGQTDIVPASLGVWECMMIGVEEQSVHNKACNRTQPGMHAVMGPWDGLLGARRLLEAVADGGVLVHAEVIHAETLEVLRLDLTLGIRERPVSLDKALPHEVPVIPVVGRDLHVPEPSQRLHQTALGTWQT